MPILLLVLFVILAIVSLSSLVLGAGELNFRSFLQAWNGISWSDHTAFIFWELRVPRTLAGVLVGAALGLSGSILQLLTRNPLADHGLLGINSGAALAIAIGLILGWNFTAIALASLFGAWVTCIIILLLSRLATDQSAPQLRLVLAGLAISSMMQGVMAMILLQQQQGLDDFRFWVLGSLARVNTQSLYFYVPWIFAGFFIVALLIKPLAVVTLGDQSAKTLGVRLNQLYFITIIAVALLTGASVALVGPIAFVGLLSAFFARSLLHLLKLEWRLSRQLILSLVLGAILLLLSDIIARLIIAPHEAPVAVVLASIGAPVLIWMVRGQHLQQLNEARAQL